MNMNNIKDLVQKDGIVFLAYGGFLSQTLIACMTESLVKEAEDSELTMNDSTNIFTIFIELAQNMMNYSKSHGNQTLKNRSEGLILVGKCEDHKTYYVLSQNIVTLEDKEKIMPKLSEIVEMSQENIKQRHRELRKSGRDTHQKGGGIGFYEIAKRSDKISFEFEQIDQNRYYFRLKAFIKIKGKDANE